MRSNEIDKLSFALCGAQADFKAIPKTDDNPFFKSKYAGLPAVVEAAQPILTKWGLAVSQTVGWSCGVDDSVFDTLSTMLLHESGQFIESQMRLHLVPDKSGVVTPQSQGSAITYARRYSYMAILGLVADEDDDGNAASPKDPALALGAMTKRRAPSPVAAPRTSVNSQASAPTPETPPEARISAADAKRELIDHAISLGWSQPDAKDRAKEAWGDQGTEGLLRGLLETLKMQIEKAPGQ